MAAPTPLNVLVVGAGAIGSVLGGLLAEHGQDVTLLGRAWHLEVIRASGLTIDGIWGAHRVTGVRTALNPEDVPSDRHWDWIFVCVKAHQTADAARLLPGLLGPATLVCAFQNGLGNYEALTAHVPSARVALGRVIFGVELRPGRAHVTVCADDVLIGSPDEAFPRERVQQLVTTLTHAGIPARATDAIVQAVWAKVVYNCALNGLSTVLELPYGGLADHPRARPLMERVIEEAYQVAAAHRIALHPSDAESYRVLLFQRLIPATAAHRSSMLQDVLAGKLTEIEALNGALVRLGQPAGVPTPTNALITRLVHAKERFVRGGG